MLEKLLLVLPILLAIASPGQQFLRARHPRPPAKSSPG